MAFSTQYAQAQQPPVRWAKRLDSGTGPDTVTNLQFYFHDTPSGSNPTAVQIVKPVANASDSNSFFGAVVMVDDPLTETADAGSKLVGRAQGMYTFSSRNESAIVMSISLGFTDGPYNGSSLSVMGKNMVMNPTRELPVLGGTGMFRMARGYAVLKTVTFNTTSGDAVVNYNVTVYTPATGESGQVSSALSSSSSSSSPRMMMRGRWWMVGAAIAAAAFL
ncbi:unnamed protein product [Linum tenue]|uniref:Dirigent protein n=1 Tax=Linum tenue TaxID=586396 RepID=A0AAV0PCT5_9ROSI|nr:unnamed protein product [Linum tenue]